MRVAALNSGPDAGARRFLRSVIAFTAVGLAVRVAYVSLVVSNRPIGGDPLYFHGLAQLLADGHGWNGPFQNWYLLGLHPTATHPPLYPLLLALSSKLGFGTRLMPHCRPGGVVSTVVTFWLHVVLLPQPSVMVNVRWITSEHAF